MYKKIFFFIKILCYDGVKSGVPTRVPNEIFIKVQIGVHKVVCLCAHPHTMCSAGKNCGLFTYNHVCMKNFWLQSKNIYTSFKTHHVKNDTLMTNSCFGGF